MYNSLMLFDPDTWMQTQKKKVFKLYALADLKSQRNPTFLMLVEITLIYPTGR